jgi:serine/threonine-protein kinase
MATPQTDVDREERLALALEAILARRKQGLPIDWSQIGQAHADLVEELRQFCAVGDLVEHVASSSKPTLPGRKTAARAAPVEPPQSIDGYEIEAEIGRGGMGIVYRAYDAKLQRHVALKMILLGGHATAENRERFRREAAAAAGLQHPHIIPVYQVGEHEGQPYFCMKHIAGPTLAQLVSEGPLPPRRAAKIMLDVARAVQHAHDHGIIHRDLKPSNVLLEGEDVPIVTDFGLAKRVEGGASLTGTGAILGTPSYMAPEQAESTPAPYLPASDVYSLGAILYELLTGRPPFLAATVVDTLLLVRSEEPVRPRLLNPQIDLDLEMIVRKCLEKRPEHRYATAAQLADDLQAFLNAEPVSARSSSLIYFINRLFRETHHAPVLENWGLLWMWHSLNLLLLCFVTSAMAFWGVESHVPYLALWSVLLSVWGAIFWNLRRRGGPVTFVERQIAHVWAAAVAASITIFIIEGLLDLPVLRLSPVLAVVSGMVFLIKAGTLSGWFYFATALCFLAVVPMTLLSPAWGPILFGLVTAVGFFVPGVKYYRQRLRSEGK